MVDQQHDWNNQPLYILDEWAAYINGSAVGHFTGSMRTPDSFMKALEITQWTTYLQEEAHKTNYDCTHLDKFIKWQRKRVENLYKAGIKQKWVHEGHKRLFQKAFKRKPK
jgi:hypothetical protein